MNLLNPYAFDSSRNDLSNNVIIPKINDKGGSDIYLNKFDLIDGIDVTKYKIYSNESDLYEGFSEYESQDNSLGLFYMTAGVFALGAILVILSKSRK